MPDSARSLDELDITDVEIYVNQGYPFAAWDRLRREAPVYWYDRPGFEPFWAITRHADVLEISKHPRVSVNSGRLRLAKRVDDEAYALFRRSARAIGWDPNEPPDMVFMDDPRHKAFRLLTSRAFTPAALRQRAPQLSEMADRFAREFRTELERAAAAGRSADLVSGYAVKLPLATIGQMMGLPAEDWEKLLVWTSALVGDDHPSADIPGEPERMTAGHGFWRLRGYFQELMDARRAAGPDRPDLTDTLLRAEIDGQRLTDQQLHGYLVLLTAAGNETTRNATAGGVEALLQHPDQRDRLCADPGMLDSAIEEILRWTSPVVQFARSAARDYELRGTKIRAGQSVGVFYPSANRDEEVFDEPYRFDIGRDPNPHLAFGHGAHFCLGANLARFELHAALTALLPLLPHMELAGPAERIPHLHVPGYKHLPVRWNP